MPDGVVELEAVAGPGHEAPGVEAAADHEAADRPGRDGLGDLCTSINESGAQEFFTKSFSATTRPCWLSRSVRDHTATPSC
jgi:hypothetical protein